ncbi:MAG: small heat shock protein IbpB [Sodalis sp. Psp]|nr:small heat shock protein IbpB [Sodalis sp. Psp]MCR3756625.1 small heat shock protein IbpB [Sodalis sp. Ppy]
MSNYDLSPLLRQWIGFDKLASSMQSEQDGVSFPSYNIEKGDNNHYNIALALAGFKQQELSIEIESSCLTIKGRPELVKKKVHYLHQGLVCKEFSLRFTLAEHMTVEQASFTNGLLNIDLVQHIPESLQPRHIAISTSTSRSELVDKRTR